MRVSLLCSTAGCLCCTLLCSSIKAQSIESDTTSHTHYHFVTVSFFSNVSAYFPRTVSGTVNVRFPYSTTDAFGYKTNYIFQSKTQKVFHSVKPYLNILGFEFGSLRQFYNIDFALGMFSGIYSSNPNVSFGYGYSWYLNGLGEHEKNMIDKRFVLRTSLNIAYTVDGGDGGQTVLGSIDNSYRTIKALGVTAKPQYTYSDDDDDVDETETAYAKNLEVSYSQRELALLPKISIGNNPYRNAVIVKNKKHGGIMVSRRAINWELSIGYNIPVYDRGGIQLAQDDGHASHRKDLKGSPVSLKNKDLTFLYNGNQTTRTPFHFSGLYISFAIRFGHGEYR